jgi:hypothetical protein
MTYHGQRVVIDVPLVSFLGTALVERSLIARFFCQCHSTDKQKTESAPAIKPSLNSYIATL